MSKSDSKLQLFALQTSTPKLGISFQQLINQLASIPKEAHEKETLAKDILCVKSSVRNFILSLSVTLSCKASYSPLSSYSWQ